MKCPRLLTTCALLAALIGPAAAQTRPDPAQRPEPAPSTAPPEKIAPAPNAPGDARESSGSSGTSLGERLSGSDGVIKPPPQVDPGMTRQAPDPGPRSMPVIAPPGTHPDDPVKPK